MTTRNFVIKWLAYALALLPVWLADAFLMGSYPIFGVKASLLPLAAMAVATLEGGTAGAGFGLGVGLLFDASTSGILPGTFILLMALLGWGAGLLAQYALRQDLIGCLICSALSLMAIDAVRIAYRLLTATATLIPMLRLAGKEILLSLCFVPLVYLLFRRIFQRVPKPTVL